MFQRSDLSNPPWGMLYAHLTYAMNFLERPIKVSVPMLLTPTYTEELHRRCFTDQNAVVGRTSKRPKSKTLAGLFAAKSLDRGFCSSGLDRIGFLIVPFRRCCFSFLSLTLGKGRLRMVVVIPQTMDIGQWEYFLKQRVRLPLCRPRPGPAHGGFFDRITDTPYR